MWFISVVYFCQHSCARATAPLRATAPVPFLSTSTSMRSVRRGVYRSMPCTQGKRECGSSKSCNIEHSVSCFQHASFRENSSLARDEHHSARGSAMGRIPASFMRAESTFYWIRKEKQNRREATSHLKERRCTSTQKLRTTRKVPLLPIH